MARTKDQSFVNAYLNQYQQNQKNAVSSGQQAASNAASGGVRQINATGNIKLPSLYDPTEDLYGLVLEQQKAQINAQQAAAKADQPSLVLTEGTVEDVHEQAGEGVVAALDGKPVLCGSRKLLARHGVDLSGYRGTPGSTEVLLAADGRFLGHIVIADTVKADAKQAVARMKAQGLVTAMLTGDGQDSADAVAQSVGIDEVRARLLPEDKLTALTGIREKRGAVLFVGDGINDAPVLAGADVGAAMGSGADAAIEAADVVFMNADLSSIPTAVRIARRANVISKENIVFALAVKLLVMALGLCGVASMWLAVFADSGVAMLCVLNSVRMLRMKTE